MSDALTNDDLELLDRIVAESIEPVDPPAYVRTLILASVQSKKTLDESIPGQHESLTVRADEGRWKTVGPGARTKKLSRNERRGTLTFLIDLDPGAILPAHDHHGEEDSYVVRGSCRIGAIALAAGDFHHVDGGAHHGNVVASDEGCQLLLTIELADAV